MVERIHGNKQVYIGEGKYGYNKGYVVPKKVDRTTLLGKQVYGSLKYVPS